MSTLTSTTLTHKLRKYLELKGFRVYNTWLEESGVYAQVDTYAHAIVPFVTQVWSYKKSVTVRIGFADLDFINA
jgi:hypothetical protein